MNANLNKEPEFERMVICLAACVDNNRLMLLVWKI